MASNEGQVKCKWQGKWQMSKQVVISKASDKNQGKLKGAGQVQVARQGASKASVKMEG
jgi:hypothetical protein